MEFSDIDLVKKAQNGDKDAFSRLYDFYYPKILGYIARRVGIMQVAADITSETFYKMVWKIKTFSFRDIPFSAWLYRIASNEIANYYRQKKTYSLETMQEQLGFEAADTTNLEEEFSAAQDALQNEKLFAQISQKLQSFPVQYQEVISLRFFEKKKTREIADIVGKPEGTIKSLLSRGIEKLQKEMEVTK
ncbi:MAG: RNA polymerase sigma factor [Candidatus Levyibacteriota bacterium]